MRVSCSSFSVGMNRQWRCTSKWNENEEDDGGRKEWWNDWIKGWMNQISDGKYIYKSVNVHLFHPASVTFQGRDAGWECISCLDCRTTESSDYLFVVALFFCLNVFFDNLCWILSRSLSLQMTLNKLRKVGFGWVRRASLIRTCKSDSHDIFILRGYVSSLVLLIKKLVIQGESLICKKSEISWDRIFQLCSRNITFIVSADKFGLRMKLPKMSWRRMWGLSCF